MIHELLRPENIHLAVKGTFVQVLRSMAAELAPRESLLKSLNPLLEDPWTLVLMPSDEVALPHLRLPGLEQPQLAMGISRHGVACLGKSPRILLLLVSPEKNPSEHLKLLQRISSLLPELSEKLASAREPSQVIKILMEELENLWLILEKLK